MNDKIVKKLLKVDFHIHSAASKKDGNLVKNNNINTLSFLLDKLEKSKINMIAITDQNAFDYELYDEIRKQIKNHKTLKKILPGIEFDVIFNEERIHVITIFDDSDEEKVKDISKILTRYEFDGNNGFLEKTFREILKEIDLSVILIAHQKSGVRASNHNENLSKVGEELFDSIIGVDYFDAVEFRSGKVEGILNDYREEKQLLNLRYITGTDCHDWKFYPQQYKDDKTDVQYSYLKCLPTFKGLVMAITEPNRISTSSYPINKAYVPELKIKINGNINNVELSSGLNVIIGDNSIGKSFLLENLYDSKFKDLERTHRAGYINYQILKKIEIESLENLRDMIHYNRQGSIRKTFQQSSSLKDVEFFNSKFMQMKNDSVFSQINKYSSNVMKLLKDNANLIKIQNELDFDIVLPSEIEDKSYNLRIIFDLNENDKDYNPIIEQIKLIESEISVLSELIDNDDNKKLNLVSTIFSEIRQKYVDKQRNLKIENSIISTINGCAKKIDDDNKKIAQQQENKLAEFKNNIKIAENKIINMINCSLEPKIDVLKDFTDIKINEVDNQLGNYHFVTRVQTPIIDSSLMEKILIYPFNRINSILDLEGKSYNGLNNLFKKTAVSEFDGKGFDAETIYKKSIENLVTKSILKQQNVILLDDDDISTGNSPGKNALIYLDILADDTSKKLCIIDQPGDDVSQHKISSELIRIMRAMSKNKQVIFITHKPELVVNLDVDNVIVFKTDPDMNINISYGALEYENIKEKVNILSDVADILDGGAETIRKRWKRYEKSS